MKIEKKFTIGDIITGIMVVIAAIALWFQARSTFVSEQQLEMQLTELTEIIERLDEQQQDFLSEQVERIRQGTELYESQNEMHQILLEINRDNRSQNRTYLSNLLFSIFSTQLALRSSITDPVAIEFLDQIQNSNRMMARMFMLSIEYDNDFSEIQEKYESAFTDLRNAIYTTPNFSELATELNNDMANEFARLNGAYGVRFNEIGQQHDLSQQNIMNMILDRAESDTVDR
jgi:hypothetical protein